MQLLDEQAIVTVPRPSPLFVIVNVRTEDDAAKFAVQVLLAVMSTLMIESEAVPLQAPLQPVNANPGATVAVS